LNEPLGSTEVEEKPETSYHDKSERWQQHSEKYKSVIKVM